MDFIITKGMVRAWLRKLIKQGLLVAPTMLKGGDVIFKEAFTPDDILLEFQQPMFPVKSFFLPQEETLFTFRERSLDTIKEVYDQFPRIFFGLRPCDLRAITQADRFFSENYQDPYYHQRRKQTLLIAIGCNKPESHCFCHVMGTGPFYSDGADIFLIDTGPTFLVTPQTPMGKQAVNNFSYFFEDAEKADKAKVVSKKAHARFRLNSNLCPDSLPDFSEIPDDFWASIAPNCFSCGSCSYICPLCFCYNVVDRENRDLAGKRVRIWDSCIFEGFTRMAGRHNLIKNRQERLYKRFAHKLKYYPVQYGIPGCTGCGRCSVTCPGKISMLELLKRVRGLNKDKAEVVKNDQE